MSELLLVNWCGALWSVGEQDRDWYRCTVVQANPVSGWHNGDHCWLTAKELHPTRRGS